MHNYLAQEQRRSQAGLFRVAMRALRQASLYEPRLVRIEQRLDRIERNQEIMVKLLQQNLSEAKLTRNAINRITNQAQDPNLPEL